MASKKKKNKDSTVTLMIAQNDKTVTIKNIKF